MSASENVYIMVRPSNFPDIGPVRLKFYVKLLQTFNILNIYTDFFRFWFWVFKEYSEEVKFYVSFDPKFNLLNFFSRMKIKITIKCLLL